MNTTNTTNIALMERPTELLAPAVTSDQLELVKKTVAAGATDAELKLYLYDCARHGVHPLDRLLHFTKRGGKYTPITGIDLMRIRAADTGECLGITDPIFIGAIKTSEFSASVTVMRFVQGQIASFSATARWTEYCPAQGQDHMWQKMPHTMLGKCAEALALRKGFPKQLAGLYAREEMDQAGTTTDTPPLVVEGAKVEAGVTVDAETSAPLAPLPEGCVYLLNVRSEPTSTGKPRWRMEIVDHLGETKTVTIWEQQMGALAEQMSQDRVPAMIALKPASKWGQDVKNLARYKPEEPEIQLRGDEPPPLTDADFVL